MNASSARTTAAPFTGRRQQVHRRPCESARRLAGGHRLEGAFRRATQAARSARSAAGACVVGEPAAVAAPSAEVTDPLAEYRRHGRRLAVTAITSSCVRAACASGRVSWIVGPREAVMCRGWRTSGEHPRPAMAGGVDEQGAGSRSARWAVDRPAPGTGAGRRGPRPPGSIVGGTRTSPPDGTGQGRVRAGLGISRR
jgi:hypothetical protein